MCPESVISDDGINHLLGFVKLFQKTLIIISTQILTSLNNKYTQLIVTLL